jgi:hypothetical protein
MGGLSRFSVHMYDLRAAQGWVVFLAPARHLTYKCCRTAALLTQRIAMQGATDKNRLRPFGVGFGAVVFGNTVLAGVGYEKQYRGKIAIPDVSNSDDSPMRCRLLATAKTNTQPIAAIPGGGSSEHREAENRGGVSEGPGPMSIPIRTALLRSTSPATTVRPLAEQEEGRQINKLPLPPTSIPPQNYRLRFEPSSSPP